MIEFPRKYKTFATSTRRYAVLLGGAGSGKSTAAALKMVLRAQSTPNLRLLVVRKVGTTLRHSCFEQLKFIIEHDEDLRNSVTQVEHRLTFKFDNGSQILCLGMDDPDKVKSITNLSCVWIEEATDLEAPDFAQLELRLRGQGGGYKQFILTFNPVREDHWLRARFCSGRADRHIYFLKTTYKNNPHLDADYRHHLRERIKADEDLYRVYTLGEWGRGEHGGEFYKHFSYARHCMPARYNPDEPLHLSFDFNLHPYITCTVWQVSRSEAGGLGFENANGAMPQPQTSGLEPPIVHARQIAEHCLATPLNYTVALCHELMARYGRHRAGVFIYGDPSGRQGGTAQGGDTDFGQIEEGLKELLPVMRQLTGHPRVVSRGQFINLILLQQHAGIQLTIDPKCLNTLADYQHLKEEDNGAKFKKRIKNPTTGVSYEEYGHCSDANDYFICRYFSDAYSRFTEPRKPIGPPPAPLFGR